jgi:uncharacterized membrane protein
MPLRLRLAQITLWFFVIFLSIEVGGGLYETRVIVPRWSASPPESVWAWADLRATNAQVAIDPGVRFWIYVMPATGLSALLALAFSFATEGAHRRWRVIATILALAVVAATFIYFVPNIILLLGPNSHNIDGAKVKTLANQWVMWNYVRAAIGIAGWLAALRAFHLPVESYTR